MSCASRVAPNCVVCVLTPEQSESVDVEALSGIANVQSVTRVVDDDGCCTLHVQPEETWVPCQHSTGALLNEVARGLPGVPVTFTYTVESGGIKETSPAPV